MFRTGCYLSLIVLRATTWLCWSTHLYTMLVLPSWQQDTKKSRLFAGVDTKDPKWKELAVVSNSCSKSGESMHTVVWCRRENTSRVVLHPNVWQARKLVSGHSYSFLLPSTASWGNLEQVCTKQEGAIRVLYWPCCVATHKPTLLLKIWRSGSTIGVLIVKVALLSLGPLFGTSLIPTSLLFWLECTASLGVLTWIRSTFAETYQILAENIATCTDPLSDNAVKLKDVFTVRPVCMGTYLVHFSIFTGYSHCKLCQSILRDSKQTQWLFSVTPTDEPFFNPVHSVSDGFLQETKIVQMLEKHFKWEEDVRFCPTHKRVRIFFSLLSHE